MGLIIRVVTTLKGRARGHRGKIPVKSQDIIPQETVSMEECAKLLRGFKDCDIMKAYIEAEIEVPEGERMYDPIYEEIWG